MSKIPLRTLDRRPDATATGLITIRDLKDILNGQDILHHLHRHTYYFILAVRKGSGLHEIDFVAHNVEDGSVFLLRPGQVHQLTLKAGSEGFLIEFDAAFYYSADLPQGQRLRKAMHRNHSRPASGSFARCFSALQTAFGEFNSKEYGYQDVIRASLDIFFIEYLRHNDSKEKSDKEDKAIYVQERFNDFTDLLEKHAAENKQVAYYASLLNLSLYQLNSITKAITGKPASDVISDHILLEAKRYLLATSSQVKEIADRLGYEDISYFIRFFKKHTGHTPESYRQNFK